MGNLGYDQTSPAARPSALFRACRVKGPRSDAPARYLAGRWLANITGPVPLRRNIGEWAAPGGAEP